MKTYEMSIAMKQIEEAWPNPRPEDEARCLRVLKAHDAMDLADMLGLA